MPYRGNEDVFKYNYVEKITKLLPDVYNQQEENQTKIEDTSYQILGKYLLAVNEFTEFFTVSSYPASSIKPFFIPENKLTRVGASDFERTVLSRFNKDFGSFGSEEDFKNYLSSVILPDIVLDTPSTTFVSGAYADPTNNFGTTSSVHTSLVEGLGLMYMLNTNSHSGATTQLSAVLVDYITSAMYSPQAEFTEKTGAECLFEYLWRNRDDVASFNRYLPTAFQQSTSSVSSLRYASGVQDLDRIKTLLSVWLEKEDEDSPFLRNSLEALEGSGLIYSKFDSSGPYTKFMKAASWAFYDLDMIMENMQDLFDIDRCPVEFLDHLAGVIGWKFLGDDVSMWRGQLRQAVYSYKAKGTRQSLVDAISTVFPKEVSSFTASSDIKECWESYLPNLIYYTLKTESPTCKDHNTLARYLHTQVGNVSGLTINIDPYDHDKNIRFCVDAILEFINKNVEFLRFNNKSLAQISNGVGFESREGYTLAVPPFEYDSFYKTTQITSEVLFWLRKALEGDCQDNFSFGFQVAPGWVTKLENYIISSTTLGTEESDSFYFGNNNFLKFFTPENGTPPNFSSVLTEGLTQELSVLDYWNSKSSNLFVLLPDNAFSGVEGLTARDVRAVSEVLYNYTPLHTISRIYEGVPLSGDMYKPEKQNIDAGMCVVIKGQLQEVNSVSMQNHTVSSWVGTHGMGGLAKIVNNPLPPTTTIENRYLPGTSGRNLLDEPALRGGTCRWDEVDSDGNPIIYDLLDINSDIPTAEDFPTLNEGQRRGYAIYEAVRSYGSFQSEWSDDDNPKIKVYASGGDGAGASGTSALYVSAEGTLGGTLSASSAGSLVFINPNLFTPGQRYRVSFWYRAALGDKRDKQISFNIEQAEFDQSTSILEKILVDNNDATLASGTGWTYHSSDFEYPSDGGSIGVSSTSSLNVSAQVGPTVWFGAFAYKANASHTVVRSETSELGIANLRVEPVFWEVAEGLERNSMRRRNYRYLLSGSDYNREGKAAPISNAFVMSGNQDILGGVGGGNAQYLPKGFNFSGQNFISPTSKSLSGIYDTSNSPFVLRNAIEAAAPAGNFLGVEVSSMFPFRGIGELLDCSSSNEKRKQFTKSPSQIFLDYALRKGQVDYSYLNFKEENMIFAEFGLDFHHMWLDYKNPWVFDSRISGGGHDVLSFAFGPLLYNSTFNERSITASATEDPEQSYEFSGLRAYRDNENTTLSSLQFKNIAGSNGIVGESFQDPNGRLIAPVLRGLNFKEGFGSYRNLIDRMDYGYDCDVWANQSILSGIELVTRANTTNIAVFNYKDFTDGCNPFLTSTELDKSLTVFGGKENITDKGNTIKARFPLVKNFNLLPNGDFQRPPVSARSLGVSSLSAVANWKLVDAHKVPSRALGSISPTNHGWVELSSVNTTSYSSIEETSIKVIQMYSGKFPQRARTNMQAAIQTTFEGKDRTSLNSPLRLLPGENYIVGWTASSLHVSAGLAYALYNETQGAWWSPATTYNWVTSPTFTRVAPSTTEGFYSIYENLNIPVSAYIDGDTNYTTFQATDRYTLALMPKASSNTNTKNLETVSSVSITQDNANTFYPNRTYKGKITIDYRDFQGMTNTFGIRLLTCPKPVEKTNDMNMFVYDWKGVGSRWQLSSPTDLRNNQNIKIITLSPFIDAISGSIQQTKEVEFEFHTHNHRGPIDPETKRLMSISRGPSYSNIHTSETAYALEFIPIMEERPFPTDNLRPYIRMRDLSIVDTVYNKAVKDFTTTEAQNFLEYFNTLRLTTATRDEAKGVSLGMGTQGGSRAEYLFPWGGPFESTINWEVSGWTPYNI